MEKANIDFNFNFEWYANGSLLDDLDNEFHESDIRCRTGIAVGYETYNNGVISRKIMDILLTPDPEIEIEEIERSKRIGKAEENDIYRDLNLYEILTSTTENVTYHAWFIEHVERINIMIPAGIKILGIYTYWNDK